jgi:hypothetical protein
MRLLNGMLIAALTYSEQAVLFVEYTNHNLQA